METMHKNTKEKLQDATKEPNKMLFQFEQCDYKCEKSITLKKHKKTNHLDKFSRELNREVDVIRFFLNFDIVRQFWVFNGFF